ncbi:IS607 family transposase [Lactobacillus delbrueckii subsp. lactis]
MSEYMSISKAAEYLNVAKSTLRNWEAEGLITPLRTASNQRRYTKEMLDEVLQGNVKAAKPKKLLTIGYCRVSSSHQKEDLQRQKDVVSRYCEVNGYQFKIIQDVGSGLNYKKKGLTELINMICNKQCERVVVNYQDRLVRFGFEVIETICQANDVELVVINQTDNVAPNSELVEDVLSIITAFSAKLYGKRSHQNARVIQESKKLFSQADSEKDSAQDS